MEFLIVSGMSGAGKSRAADVLEDMDFYCVDNMPAALLPRFAEFCMGMSGRYERVALVTDIRDRGGFEDMAKALDALKALGCEYHILFVEANVPTVVKRYKESRRPHPLQHECPGIEQAVRLEASRLGWLRDRADYIINTSHLTLGQIGRDKYQRRTCDGVGLAVYDDLDLRIQLIGMLGVGAEKADYLGAVVGVGLKNGVNFGHGAIPRSVHLESTGHKLIVYP